MPTRTEIADAIRTRNPKFKDLSDIEIEAIVGAQDPRYRDLFNRASGVDPGLGPEKPPSPRQYEAPSSPRTEKLEAFQRDTAPTPVSVDSAVDTIPAISGMAGGIGGAAVGGPVGAIAGAGGAASAGEGLRQWIQEKRGKEASRSLPERGSAMVKEGVINAAGEALGVGAAGLQKAVAPALYRWGAKPSARLAKEFPTVIEDAIESGIPISRRGQAQAESAVAASHAQADAMIAKAEQDGAPPIDLMREILEPTLADVGPKARLQARLGHPQGEEGLAKQVGQIQAEHAAPPPRQPPVKPPERELTPGYEALLEQQRQLGHMSNLLPSRLFEPTSNEVRVGRELGSTAMTIPRRVISGEPAKVATETIPHKPFFDVPLTEGQQLKREGQKLSDRAWRSEERGIPINDIETETDSALAKHLQIGLEKRVEGLGDVNATTQRGLGVDRMIDASRARNGGLKDVALTGGLAAGPGIALATGHPLTAAGLFTVGALTKAAMSPYAMSKSAIGLDRLSRHPQMQANAYRAMVEALRRMMDTDEVSTPQQ
jgi:hypothetical protein